MTIEQISDAAKQLKKKYDETDPERLAEQMKILVSREPMGLFEGCCKGFFLVHRRKKHITINGDLPDVLQKVVLAHELGHCVLHSGSSSAAFHDVILFDTADQKEYEANVFASELLLPDEAVLEVLNDDMFFFQAAKALYVPSELLDFKFRILKKIWNNGLVFRLLTERGLWVWQHGIPGMAARRSAQAVITAMCTGRMPSLARMLLSFPRQPLSICP